MALVVSGGHTPLALIEGHGCYRLLGQTRDDAAGEAFDKAGGSWAWASPAGLPSSRPPRRPPAVVLPRARLRDSYDFSFSGLKTAVLHQIQGRQNRESKVATKSLPQRGNAAPTPPAADGRSPAVDRQIAQLAFAFQESR
ncbi:MAG: hypothetical protein U0Z44_13565 [Kouleothrix sp.]